MQIAQLREALKQHPDALKSLPETTRDRYRAGQLPKAILWLLRHPGLLRTLADMTETPSETLKDRT